MSSINWRSPLQEIIPVEVNLQILSFLGKRDLQAVTCTCKIFENLSKDFQIWKPKLKLNLGNL
ncbi:F-box-like domain-containing protein [Candidatus Protochlamydia sp. W-9]|uniref:F-box-like domain-containing protein n=1 Tax=Candidatus Protochlamydia sp. W-9 TaxID=1785087 RepID=UPI00096A9DFF